MWDNLLEELPGIAERSSVITGVRVYADVWEVGNEGLPSGKTSVNTLDIFVEVDAATFALMRGTQAWQYPFDAVDITTTIGDAVLDHAQDAGISPNEMLVIGSSRHTALVHAGVDYTNNTYTVPQRVLAGMVDIAQQAVPGTPDDHLLDMWDQIPKWAHELEGYPFTFDADKHAGMVSIHLVPPGSHFSGPEVNLLVLEMNLGWNFADQMSGFEEGAANMAHTEARIQNARCIYGPDA